MTAPLYGVLDNPMLAPYQQLKEVATYAGHMQHPKFVMHDPTPHIEKEGVNRERNITSKDFSYVVSAGIHRRINPNNEPEHDLCGLVHGVLKTTLNHNELGLGKILRSALNVTYPFGTKQKAISLPHVDDEKKHLVVLFYLNSTSGDTVLCNETSNPYKAYLDPSKVTTAEKIAPEEDKVIIFEGSRYHYNYTPKVGDPSRLVLVANITLS